jgi:membrane protein implicated in regulation of membrane protease activity
MVSRRLVITGTVAACAACCAPLVVPLVWPALIAAGLAGTGGLVSGWLASLPLDVILCSAIALAVLAGGAMWLRKRGRQMKQVSNLADGAQCDLESCGPERKKVAAT